MRKPKLHKFFAGNADTPSPGLSRYLAGLGSKGLICHDNGNLCFIPAGPVPPNPVDLLVSDRFSQLMQALSKRFDRVITVLLSWGLPILWCSHVRLAGLCWSSTWSESTRDSIRHFKKGMLNAQGKVLGCIINKVNLDKRFGYPSYYQYYSYYHYYGYGEKKGSRKKKKQLKAIS